MDLNNKGFETLSTLPHLLPHILLDILKSWCHHLKKNCSHLLERQKDRDIQTQRKREVSRRLVYSPRTHGSRGRVRMKPEAGNSVWVLHTHGRTQSQRTSTAVYTSSKLSLGEEAVLQYRLWACRSIKCMPWMPLFKTTGS